MLLRCVKHPDARKIRIKQPSLTNTLKIYKGIAIVHLANDALLANNQIVVQARLRIINVAQRLDNLHCGILLDTIQLRKRLCRNLGLTFLGCNLGVAFLIIEPRPSNFIIGAMSHKRFNYALDVLRRSRRRCYWQISNEQARLSCKPKAFGPCFYLRCSCHHLQDLLVAQLRVQSGQASQKFPERDNVISPTNTFAYRSQGHQTQSCPSFRGNVLEYTFVVVQQQLYLRYSFGKMSADLRRC
mmetsp:Transcript_82288/g.129579  ORF Transcript_82288/g.129579 Transcript_82288/m.129579 type:complete len:242 (+) Transcript_82288:1398-2123(+)